MTAGQPGGPVPARRAGESRSPGASAPAAEVHLTRAVTAGRGKESFAVVADPGTGAFLPPERRDVGMVFQNYALWPQLTMARNVEFGLRLRRLPAEARRARVAEALAAMEIADLAGRYPNQLSGGQQPRVAIARTLAVEPQVLLLDEPLSNLDARLRLEMRAVLKRLHTRLGATIVLVTHDQWEAMTLASTIAVMRSGCIAGAAAAGGAGQLAAA